MWCHDADLRGARVFVLLFTVFLANSMIGTEASAQTRIIPSLSVSEMYDSNVFFTPKSLLSPGSKPEDFVTTVMPQINVAHTGSLIQGSMFVGGMVTRYLHNPDLDFIGINAGGVLNFKNMATKLSPRIMSLTVTGTYQFVPTMSGFGAVQGGSLGTSFGATGGGALNAGLIANRVSMHTMNLGASGGYQLTRSTMLLGSYTYTKMSFGNQSGGLDIPLFDTQAHAGMTGISTQVTPTDTVGTSALLSHYIQGQSNGTGEFTFTTITGTMNWSKRWTPTLSTNLAAGGIMNLPIASTIPGQSVKSQVAPTATVVVNYTSYAEGLRAAASAPGPFDGLPGMLGSLNPGVVVPPGQYRTAFSYNYGIYPTYAFGAGPLKAHVLGINSTAGITSKLTGQVGMNYSHGSSNFPLTTYDTAGFTASAVYLMGPVLANLTYNWLYFSNSFAQAGQGPSEYAFSKKMILLSFSYAFTPGQSFFRMDRFGRAGGSDSLDSAATPSESGPGNVPPSDGPGILKKE